MKQGFQSELSVQTIDSRKWLVLEDFAWVGSNDDPDIFRVFAGDTTDFASVPWWSQFILPRTGAWTKASVLHDKMCDLLNSYYTLKKQHDDLVAGWRMLNEFSGLNQPEPIEPIKPKFNSVDTDAVFRKNAREGGTDRIRAELLWFGVRCGALKNPARRTGWMSTFPRFLSDLVAILGVLALIGYLAFAVL